ncbi:hypothetical protein BDZ88DRAFT_431551 [Geranomyces variabilis]|nr:hypothetical protein BDZ88DRAFT_431551 [Geranomyces variabilis]KAJ3131638.1 hypothetical protein HDU90_008160 [Geranomyces variabilis]
MLLSLRPLVAIPRAAAPTAAARHALASRSLTTATPAPTITSLAPAFLPYPLHAALNPPALPPLPARSTILSPFIPTATSTTASPNLTIDAIFAPHLAAAAAATTPAPSATADALLLASPRQPAMHMISIIKRRRMKMKKHKWKKGRKAVRDSTRYNRERRKKGGVQREKQE